MQYISVHNANFISFHSFFFFFSNFKIFTATNMNNWVAFHDSINFSLSTSQHTILKGYQAWFNAQFNCIWKFCFYFWPIHWLLLRIWQDCKHFFFKIISGETFIRIFLLHLCRVLFVSSGIPPWQEGIKSVLDSYKHSTAFVK